MDTGIPGLGYDVMVGRPYGIAPVFPGQETMVYVGVCRNVNDQRLDNSHTMVYVGV